MRLYRQFETQEEIDREYDPSLTSPASGGLLAGWAQRSAAARERPGSRLGLRYGPTREEYLDFFPAGSNAPLHLFIHGGYWRRLGAGDFSAVALPLVEAGVAVAVVNYALCPTVTIDEITRQIRASVAWCFAHAKEIGCDPERLTISGHSAGGHLTAMALQTDWSELYGLAADILKAGMPVSGLFDLAPFPWSWLQPKLQLTEREVDRNSPIRHLRSGLPRQLVLVGGAESTEFRRQSAEYGQACGGLANEIRVVEVPGADHVTVLDAVYRADGQLLPELLALAKAD